MMMGDDWRWTRLYKAISISRRGHQLKTTLQATLWINLVKGNRKIPSLAGRKH
jgi:hypothetical protein